jgi:hypothetical protein
MTFDAMNLDHDGWTALEGGYRVPYDPREALRTLERGDAAQAWEELWTELYHQGDVGLASYAAVPQLVRIHEARGVADWNTYALVAIIEEARQAGHNPDLPESLRGAYHAAWRRLAEVGMRELPAAVDRTLISAILAVVAMAKGQFSLGRFAVLFTDDERKEILAKAGWT